MKNNLSDCFDHLHKIDKRSAILLKEFSEIITHQERLSESLIVAESLYENFQNIDTLDDIVKYMNCVNNIAISCNQTKVKSIKFLMNFDQVINSIKVITIILSSLLISLFMVLALVIYIGSGVVIISIILFTIIFVIFIIGWNLNVINSLNLKIIEMTLKNVTITDKINVMLKGVVSYMKLLEIRF